MLFTINLEILLLDFNQKKILHIVTAQKSITDKIPVFYKYKNKYNW